MLLDRLIILFKQGDLTKFLTENIFYPLIQYPSIHVALDSIASDNRLFIRCTIINKILVKFLLFKD